MLFRGTLLHCTKCLLAFLISTKQSGHCLLTSDINKAFSPRERDIFGSFCGNHGTITLPDVQVNTYTCNTSNLFSTVAKQVQVDTRPPKCHLSWDIINTHTHWQKACWFAFGHATTASVLSQVCWLPMRCELSLPVQQCFVWC